MSIFKRKNKQPDYIDIPADMIVPNVDEVRNTIEQTGLLPGTYLVVGSAALTLYGLTIDGVAGRKANDVDMVVSPDLHKQILENMQLPNGTPIAPLDDNEGNKRIGLISVEEGRTTLPVEIMRGEGEPLGNYKSFDDAHAAGQDVDGVQVSSLGPIYERKTSGVSMLRPEQKRMMDLYDAMLIRAHNDQRGDQTDR